jgi:alginate O-acetyltransferase complex protein AlgF
MRVLGLLVALICILAVPAKAADVDEGLYAPKPPAGSSFIRFFNPSLEPISMTIGKKYYGDLASMNASPYFVQPKGKIEFKSGKEVIPHDLEEGGFYTVIIDKAGNVLMHGDTALKEPEKAMLVLYNLGSKDPLTLKVKDGLITVIEKAELGKSGNRGLNPVKVDLSIFDTTGKQITKLEPVVLERGHVYSVFYANDKAVMVKGETDTTR